MVCWRTQALKPIQENAMGQEAQFDQYASSLMTIIMMKLFLQKLTEILWIGIDIVAYIFVL